MLLISCDKLIFFLLRNIGQTLTARKYNIVLLLYVCHHHNITSSEHTHKKNENENEND